MKLEEQLEVIGVDIAIELYNYDDITAGRLGLFVNKSVVPYKYMNYEVELVKPYQAYRLTIAIRQGE